MDGGKTAGRLCVHLLRGRLFSERGFAEERVVECHGSLEHLQCVKPCCAATWPAPADLQLAIDPETLRAGGELPRCLRCGGLARPNLLMTGEKAWSSGRTLAQQVRFRAWLASLARGKFGVMEIGHRSRRGRPCARRPEDLAAAGRVPLIRLGIRPGPEDSPNVDNAGRRDDRRCWRPSPPLMA